MVLSKPTSGDFRSTSVIYGDGGKKVISWFLRRIFRFQRQLHVVNYGTGPNLIYTSARNGKPGQ